MFDWIKSAWNALWRFGEHSATKRANEELREENRRLLTGLNEMQLARKELEAGIQDLERKLAYRDQVRLDTPVLWFRDRRAEPGSKELAICPKCWTDHDKPVPVEQASPGSGVEWRCSTCGHTFGRRSLPPFGGHPRHGFPRHFLDDGLD